MGTGVDTTLREPLILVARRETVLGRGFSGLVCHGPRWSHQCTEARRNSKSSAPRARCGLPDYFFESSRDWYRLADI